MMGHLLLGIENLTVTLLLVAVAIALASRIRNRWLRLLLAALVVFVPLLGYALLTSGDAYFEYSQNVRTGLFVPLLLLSVLFLGGATWLVVRGLRASDSAEGAKEPATPAARHWPLGKLALVLVAVAVLHVVTYLNLDAAMLQRVGMLRSEAYSLAMSVAPAPVPDQDNAALDYLEVQEALDRGEPYYDKISPEWPQIWRDALDSLQPKARSEETDPAPDFDFASAEIGHWLAGRQGEIQLLRQAATKPGCRFDRNYGLDWGEVLPEIQGMRQSAWLLAVDARHRAATGDMEGALANIEAIYGISRHLAGEPFGITMLVAAAIDAMALDTLQATLRASDSAPETSLADVDPNQRHSYRRDMPRILRSSQAMTLHTAINLETLMREEFVNSSRGSMVFLNPVSLEGQLGSLYRVFLLMPDLAQYRDTVQRLYRLSSKPYGETKERLAEIRSDLDKSGAGSLTRLAETQLGEIEVTFLADARNRVAQTALAMHRYRAANGKFPSTLAELTPNTIPLIPSDPYDEEHPLKLETTANGWVVYSIGPDQRDGRGESLVWGETASWLGDVRFEYVEQKNNKEPAADNDGDEPTTNEGKVE